TPTTTIDADPDVNSYWPPTFPPTDPVRIVYFGDSITRGYGIRDQDVTYTELLRTNADDAWPDWHGDDLDARFGDLEVIDVSLDGATTDDVLDAELPDLEDLLGPSVSGQTIVVGTIGGNDILDVAFSGDLDGGREHIEANIAAIMRFFQDPVRFPDGTFIAMTNVYDPTDGVAQVNACFFGIDLGFLQPTFDRLNADTRQHAVDNGWAWVDLHGHFIGHGFRYDEQGEWTDAADPTLWFQRDCIHPNERGHHEVRRLFLAALDGEPLAVVPPPVEGR
ncbi:MAG: SGNH/GDSL hydrolase family protein, partial [Myxococcota bacterium]